MRTSRRAQYLTASPVEDEGTRPEFLDVGAPTVLEVLEDTKTGRREIVGLALPYGEDLERMDWFSGATRQRFAPGAGVVRENATLFYGHDHLTRGLPVGRITEAEQLDEGLRLRSRFAKTPKADEVYELAKPDEDGKAVLDRFSVGFYPIKSHLEENGKVLVHDEVDVFEVSLTHDPAFQSATVDSVLNRNPNTPKETLMPCSKCGKVHAPGVTECQSAPSTLELSPDLLARLNGAASAEDVQTLSGSITDLERRIATLGTGGADEAVTVPGSSYGEFLQMVAANDKAAVDFLAYVGGTVDDLGDVLKDSWVGERFRVVEAQRTLLNVFSSSPLPATGMGVEYGVIGTDTTQVGKQAAEGDVLPYGKITFATARAALETYGGWGELSRQEIERSPVNVVERFFNALLNRYARVTEAAVEARVTAGGTALTGGVTDMATADGWIKFIIRAAKVLKDQGYPLEVIAVSWDVFEDLATLRDGGNADAPRLLDRNSGQINIPGLKGDMFSLPVVPFTPSAGTDVIRAGNSEAIRTYEASGAPFRLNDDDITNLTKAFSIYGYMADATEVPGALVKPQTA